MASGLRSKWWGEVGSGPWASLYTVCTSCSFSSFRELFILFLESSGVLLLSHHQATHLQIAEMSSGVYLLSILPVASPCLCCSDLISGHYQVLHRAPWQLLNLPLCFQTFARFLFSLHSQGELPKHACDPVSPAVNPSFGSSSLPTLATMPSTAGPWASVLTPLPHRLHSSCAPFLRLVPRLFFKMLHVHFPFLFSCLILPVLQNHVPRFCNSIPRLEEELITSFLSIYWL